MPVSLTRGSFQDYFSMDGAKNQVHWSSLAQASMYNVDTIQASLRGVLFLKLLRHTVGPLPCYFAR